MDKLDEKNSRTPEAKVKFDLISISVVACCVLFLFYATLKGSNIINAAVVSAIIIVFPLSFRIPLLLLTKNRTRGLNIELLIFSFIYLIGLIILVGLSPKWKVVFIFPGIFVVMMGLTLIEKVFKRLFFRNS